MNFLKQCIKGSFAVSSRDLVEAYRRNYEPADVGTSREGDFNDFSRSPAPDRCGLGISSKSLPHHPSGILNSFEWGGIYNS
jgi:hypothetical protein